MMELGGGALLFAASAAAGALNSFAGGGSLLSFPAAIAAGLPPIAANATNAAAMVPGSFAAAWAYRRDLSGCGRLVLLLSIPAAVGALAGAAILRHTPARVFDGVVPWLVLLATVLILSQELILRAAPAAPAAPALGPGLTPSPPASPAITSRRLAAVLACQLALAVYGGYFGAAMGIVMLAFLGLLRLRDFHQINAVKNVMAVVINGAAAIDFVAHGLVDLPVAALMVAGAVIGGAGGARVARRISARLVRRLVVGIGFAMTALLAYRRWG